jgi:hypothetical protein
MVNQWYAKDATEALYMNNKQLSSPGQSLKTILPPSPRCACPGCQRHINRLEELNAQLARENDRLHRELREGKRAA